MEKNSKIAFGSLSPSDIEALCFCVSPLMKMRHFRPKFQLHGQTEDFSAPKCGSHVPNRYWGHFQNKTYWEVGVEKDNSDIEPSNIYNILLLFLLTHICRPVQRTDPLEEFLEVWSPNQSLIPPCPTQFSSSLIKLDLTPIFYKGCCLITAFTTGERTWTSKVLWMRKPAIKSESISQIAFDRSRRSVKGVFIRFFYTVLIFSFLSSSY